MFSGDIEKDELHEIAYYNVKYIVQWTLSISNSQETK